MKFKAFTLAELLIALAVLGVIATFTIPKVLVAQQGSTWKSAGKEFASTLSQAYDAYKLDNGTPTANFNSVNLQYYLNYVKIDSVSAIDGTPGSSPTQCSWYYCLRLHSGALLFVTNAYTFGGTSKTNTVQFLYDPDGKQTDGATASNANGSLSLSLYYNGKVTSTDNRTSSDVMGISGSPTSMWPESLPSWFSWN